MKKRIGLIDRPIFVLYNISVTLLTETEVCRRCRTTKKEGQSCRWCTGQHVRHTKEVKFEVNPRRTILINNYGLPVPVDEERIAKRRMVPCTANLSPECEIRVSRGSSHKHTVCRPCGQVKRKKISALWREKQLLKYKVT